MIRFYLISFLFLLLSLSLQAQNAEKSFVDREQERIDNFDNKVDHKISIGSDDMNEHAGYIYFDLLDSIESAINTCSLSEEQKRNLRAQLYVMVKGVGPRNATYFTYYERLFTQVYSIIRAMDIGRLEAELYRNVYTSISLLPYYKDFPNARQFMFDAAALYPDEVLRVYGDYKEKEWARDLVITTMKVSPLSIKKYLTLNHPVQQIIAGSSDPAAIQVMAIYKAYGVKTNAYVFLEPIVNEGMNISRADSLGKKELSYLRSMLKIRRKNDVLARYSLDRELEFYSLRYVREINDMHDISDAKIRFACSADMDARDIYTLMVYSQDEIFTSTFLGLFDRLLMKMKPLRGDQLLANVGYNRFRTFIKLCAGFNTLDRFLKTMDAGARTQMLQDFVSNLESSRGDLSAAVDVADAFGSIKDSTSLKVIESALLKEYDRVSLSQEKEGRIIYGLLITLFKDKARSQKANYEKISKEYSLPVIDKIPLTSLVNEHGQHIEAVFFFDDDDGKASFATFMETFNKPDWSVERRGMYVVIHSRNKKVQVIANTPESEEQGGQEAIVAYLDSNGLTPHVIVHRGHSYYAGKTIDRIRSQTKIVIMGSCGGYNRLTDIIDHSPEVQIIATKQIGTMLVNNPMLYLLASQMSAAKDINWVEFWANLGKIVKSNKAAADKFEDYIPPYRNLGAIFLQSYRKALVQTH